MRHLYQHVKTHVTSIADAPLGAPNNWVALTIPSSVTRNDLGFLGIVDKLLAVRANVFLSGAPGECGRRSSFTRQIAVARGYLDTSENVIDHFYKVICTRQ